MGVFSVRPTGDPDRPWSLVGCDVDVTALRYPHNLVLSCNDLGFLAHTLYRPYQVDGPFACPKCGAPVVPCDSCGNPAVCGEPWCRPCHPHGSWPPPAAAG